MHGPIERYLCDSVVAFLKRLRFDLRHNQRTIELTPFDEHSVRSLTAESSGSMTESVRAGLRERVLGLDPLPARMLAVAAVIRNLIDIELLRNPWTVPKHCRGWATCSTDVGSRSSH